MNRHWPTRTAWHGSICRLMPLSGNSAVTLPEMRMRANNTWLCSAPTSLRGGRFAAVTRNVRIWKYRWNESVWIPPCIGRSVRQQPPLIWMTTSCKSKSCKGYVRPVPSEISGAPCRKAEKGRRRRLAADLNRDTRKAAATLQRTLPQLWQKRTAWEEARSAEHPHRGPER